MYQVGKVTKYSQMMHGQPSIKKTVGVYDTNFDCKVLEKAIEIFGIVCSPPFRSHILANRSIRRGFFSDRLAHRAPRLCAPLGVSFALTITGRQL